MKNLAAYNLHTCVKNFPSVLTCSEDDAPEVSARQSLGVLPPKGRIFAPHPANAKYLNVRGGAMTLDPVCGMPIEEKNPEFQAMFAGKKYFFCSDECRKEFEERPEEFVETAA